MKHKETGLSVWCIGYFEPLLYAYSKNSLLNFVLLVSFSHDPVLFKCVTSVPEGLVITRQFIGAIPYLGNDIGRHTFMRPISRKQTVSVVLYCTRVMHMLRA